MSTHETSAPSPPHRRGLWLALGMVIAAGVAWGLWQFRTAPPTEPPPATIAPPVPAGPAWFADVTADAGIDFTYRNGEEANRYTILESLGGGVGLIDYDGDGLLDIFLTGGGTFDGDTIKGFPHRLYRNLGNGKFQDVTAAVGLDQAPFYTHGVAVADHDGDGWPDLLVTGYQGMMLYHNISDGKAGRRFVDVTKDVGLTDSRWCTSAAWVDVTGKGRPDLYVCRYVDWSFANDPKCYSKSDSGQRDVCAPQAFKPLPHSLYRYMDGQYHDVSAEAGLRKDGKGLGVVVADFNDDGRPDIYVANDAGDNFLYLNRGAGKLEEKGALASVAVDDHGRYNGSMGVDAGDYDGSGRASLFVANFQGEYHALYRNLGQERFLYQTQAAGLSALGQSFVGFGTNFVDVDNDGWLDLVIVNGHVLRYPVGASFQQRPVLLRNVDHHGRRFFRDISPQGGAFFASPALGRGVAIGDLDNDGWPDLVISHSNSPVVLLRNQAPARKENHWLGVQLRGKNHRPIAGATVTLEVGDRRLIRFAKSGGSYCSSNDPRILFGLGPETKVGRLTVRWPWGETQSWTLPAVDRYWELVEGEAAPREPAGSRR